jgi:hypothetical protein
MAGAWKRTLKLAIIKQLRKINNLLPAFTCFSIVKLLSKSALQFEHALKPSPQYLAKQGVNMLVDYFRVLSLPCGCISEMLQTKYFRVQGLRPSNPGTLNGEPGTFQFRPIILILLNFVAKNIGNTLYCPYGKDAGCWFLDTGF